MGRWIDRVERWRIQAHLVAVTAKLRARECTLPPEVAARRRAKLSQLERYATAGLFPLNDTTHQATPIFVDTYGTPCAVAAMVGPSRLVDDVRSSQNLARIDDIADPRLDAWARGHGLDRRELALIQPAYVRTALDVAQAGALPIAIAWLALAHLWLTHLVRRIRPLDPQRHRTSITVAAIVVGVAGLVLLNDVTDLLEWRQQARSLPPGAIVISYRMTASPHVDVLLGALAVGGLSMALIGALGIGQHASRWWRRAGVELKHHLASTMSWLTVVLALATWTWALTQASFLLDAMYACGEGRPRLGGWLPLPHVTCTDGDQRWRSYVDTVWIILTMAPVGWLLWRRRTDRPTNAGVP